MAKKIDATYIDNSKMFTSFKDVIILLDEDYGYKIKIGRTTLTEDKTKDFEIDIVGLSRNVYVKIRTAKKRYEFRDIDFEYVDELRKFEKKQVLRKRRNKVDSKDEN